MSSVSVFSSQNLRDQKAASSMSVLSNQTKKRASVSARQKKKHSSLNPRSRNLMGIKNRAQHLFNAVKDHELQKRVSMVSTDVKVDAGEVMVFRNYLDDIGLMIPVSDDQYASFRPDTRRATLRLTYYHVDDSPHIRLALSEPPQEKIFAVFVDEILSALEVDPSTPGGTVSIMLKRWRELFKESRQPIVWTRSEEHTSEIQSRF